MEDTHGNIKQLYQSDDYISKNPTLHEEDSQWKLEKIRPMLDRFLSLHREKKVVLMDVGGGAGIILKEVADYLRKTGGRETVKYALDLSPGMLEVQKRNNPDLALTLSADISQTQFKDKEIDLLLMIDIIEHVPNPTVALKELGRIAKFIIFKVPLDNNLFYRTQNWMEKGKLREWAVKNLGHINAFSYAGLRNDITANTGEVLQHSFTNVFKYSLRPEAFEKNLATRWGRFENKVNRIASLLFLVSPRLASLLFNDFAMLFVKCR